MIVTLFILFSFSQALDTNCTDTNCIVCDETTPDFCIKCVENMEVLNGSCVAQNNETDKSLSFDSSYDDLDGSGNGDGKKKDYFYYIIAIVVVVAIVIVFLVAVFLTSIILCKKCHCGKRYSKMNDQEMVQFN